MTKPNKIKQLSINSAITNPQEPLSLEEIKEYYSPPITLGAPKNIKLAMDNSLEQANWFQSIAYMLGEQAIAPRFLGYPYLSSLCQNGLIKSGIDIISNEMTRKFVNIKSKSTIDLSIQIKQIEEWCEKFKIKDKFKEAVTKTKYNGGCLAYMDFGEASHEELKKPLILNKCKIKQNSFRGLRVIEPLLISPGFYNATNPLKENYFNPKTFFIQGIEVHKSRFLYFADNEPALLLKPAYNFFGIPTAQIVLDYVNDFLKNRDSTTRLLNKFSLTVFKSDLTTWLNGGTGDGLAKRLNELAKLRTNDSVLLADKETEDFLQLNTPLSGVIDIFNSSLDLIPIMFRIPKMKYLQLQQAGMNNGNTEYQNFNDFILSEKEVLFRPALETLLKISQLDLFGTIDDSITFDFENLYELNEKERAEVNSLNSQIAERYVKIGSISPQEVREELANNPESGFDNINININNNKFNINNQLSIQNTNGVQESTSEVLTENALNGAQVSSMVEVSNQVANKIISYESGLNILKTAFKLDDNQASLILGTKT